MTERFDTEAWRKDHPDEVYGLGPSCKVCCWHPQGKGKAGDFGRLCDAVDRHEAKHHPEFVAWQKGYDPIAAIHDLHKNCEHVPVAKCKCICQCDADLYSCRVFPRERICTDCEVRVMRGDDEHGDVDEIRDRLRDYDEAIR